jgi:large subunit ribosomal protein L13
VRIANILRGKTKPIIRRTWTRRLRCRDQCGEGQAQRWKDEQKKYQSYSGFPGGHRFTKAGVIRARKPAYLIAHAVKDMLPRNKLSRQLIRRLKIYAGAEHPHAAQNPQASACKRINGGSQPGTEDIEYVATGRRKRRLPVSGSRTGSARSSSTAGISRRISR